ncbi:membrane-spanning 4-domains subfamily A member 4D-like isoform X1 [Pseudorasbora parva]|uniref:membrane-spanning 4-domains subfamily A member 4D-like isoform X1 n=1 Tax=Pseudorasbora parva TaxID=51549 RepID=UPI00351E744E
MLEDRAATADASEPISMVTGGSKPLHHFLKGQPKCIGIVLVMMGVCLVMFGIALNGQVKLITFEERLTPFWLGTLFCMCGLLYILSECNPSKKFITASLALSIISTIAAICACVQFGRSIFEIKICHVAQIMGDPNSTEEMRHFDQFLIPFDKIHQVFFSHSLIGGILLVTMSFFARAALKSSRTQTVVVMRNLPSAE